MRLFYLLPIFLLAACGGARDSASVQTGGQAEAEHIDTLNNRAVQAPFTILEASVEGDSLRVELQYGGGFRTHQFQLISAGIATKSLPRQQPLKLLHDADGDMGRALITEHRSFDLVGFRDASQPRIRLKLEGWPEMLEYTYPL